MRHSNNWPMAVRSSLRVSHSGDLTWAPIDVGIHALGWLADGVEDRPNISARASPQFNSFDSLAALTANFASVMRAQCAV